MKSVLLLGQIMFYLRIFNSQAQLGTRDMQKLDFEKVVFTSKKPEFMIFDMLPKRPIILYCAKKRQALYYMYGHESCHFLCPLCTTKN